MGTDIFEQPESEEVEERGGKVVPRLIAPPGYLSAPSGVVEPVGCSVDMIRIRGKIRPSDLDTLTKMLDTWTAPESSDFFTSNRIGGYRFMWVFGFGETSVKVGWAHVGGSSKIDPRVGFVEYNPNKVGEEGAALLDLLSGRCGAAFQPVRWDLALDFAVDRAPLRVVKDHRKYACEISSAVTEYLGQRNKAGRVKVYDKAAEQGLEFSLTRVELTCDAEWSVDEIVEHLPAVYAAAAVDFDGLKGITKAYACMLMRLVEYGGSVEVELQSLSNKRTRAKIRKILAEHAVLAYPADAIARVADRVARWGVGGAGESGATLTSGLSMAR